MNESTMSEHAYLLRLINGFMASRAVHMAAELAIADLLSDGTRTSEDLARETGTDPASLHRLLRVLTSLGVLEETSPGHFALTKMGYALRSDVTGSLRDFALMSGGERMWRIWGDLLRSIQTGEPATPRLYGVESFDYFAAHPAEAAIFNRAMANVTHQATRAVVATCDFTRFHEVVDVGGGNGALMAGILAAVPALKGIVFDLPSGMDDAQRQLQAAGVADRCEVVAGDFFHSVPVADAYILKNVTHDWDDPRATAILRSCRTAMPPHGTLLLIERVMPERMEMSSRHQRMATLDLHMLVGPGGRERTEAEFKEILARAGFAWTSTSPLPGELGLSVIEGRPV